MVKKRRLLWMLYPSFLVITLAALMLATWSSTRTFRRFYISDTETALAKNADLMRSFLAEPIAAGDFRQVEALSREYAKRFQNRITIILPDGMVIADSEKNTEQMEKHDDRPEVTSALEGATGTAIRFSDTVGTDMLYVAVPLIDEQEGLKGVVRASLPLISIRQTLYDVYARMVLGGLLAVALTAVISLAVSRRITRPIEDLRRGAERFASGDLAHKLHVPDSLEIGSLAEAMNQMATQLSERIRIIFQQNNHLQALLASMAEGVLAVDNDARLTSINDTAAAFFGLSVSDVKGCPITHAIRNADLIDFINMILSTHRNLEAELVLHHEEGKEVFLQAHGAVLRDSQEREIGAVVVLNDLTRLRRLERIRSDFVANVSHELKTPITSIKGFVETLQDGAINDNDSATRFLAIIARQADRLAAIIDDLLSLSLIEQDENSTIKLESCSVADVLSAAVDVCRPKAEATDVKLVLDVADDPHTEMNAPLMEQAVVNLIDNAIQYSLAGATVTAGARQIHSHIIISVTDYGCGIAAEHLSRIFERFYRVDKARSRILGGTGLGLSIVKHIAKLHNATAHVSSTPGKGSRFEIRLPLVRQNRNDA